MEHLSHGKDRPNQHENSHKPCNKSKGSHCEYDGKSMENETTTSSEFPNGGKAIVGQMLVSEEINPKEQDSENHSLGYK